MNNSCIEFVANAQRRMLAALAVGVHTSIYPPGAHTKYDYEMITAIIIIYCIVLFASFVAVVLCLYLIIVVVVHTPFTANSHLFTDVLSRVTSRTKVLPSSTQLTYRRMCVYVCV